MPSINGTSGDDTLVGSADADVINGLDGNDVLGGGAGSDDLYGGAGNDRLDGGAGSDTLVGGAGDDVYFVDSALDDVYESGDGLDTVYASVNYNLNGMGQPNPIEILSAIDLSATTPLVLIGNSYANRIVGNAGDNVLNGDGGDDILDGGNGNDTLRGGVGNDTLTGGDGDDVLDGGAGDDLANGDGGNDEIAGREGNDRINGGSGNDLLAGNAGADTIDGGSGDDTLFSGDESAPNVPPSFGNPGTSPSLDTGTEQDTLIGGDGGDTLSVGYGDNVDGGTGNDTLRLSLGGLAQGINFNTSGIVSGQPFTLGGGTVQNVETLEYLRGTEFADTLSLATQGSLLTVNAGAGNDVILSQDSAVALSGGDGDDIFYTGSAGDYFDGGNGFDAILYVQALTGVTVTLGLDGAIGTGTGGDRLINVESIVGSYQDDHLTGNEQANVLSGEAGADTLSGGAGNDYLYGGDGDDSLVGETGNDILEGGTGIDTMTGGLGDDLYYVNVSEEVVQESGPDGGYDIVSSRAAHFILPANVEFLQLLDPAGHSSGHGNEQDNYLAGNAGDNVLKGFGGNDTLSGWDGADVLTGGAGDDTFQGTAAHLDGDTIADWARGDRIVVSDADLATFSFSLSGTTLTYTGGSLTLGSLPASRIVATAAPEGGVQLAIAADARHDFNSDGRSDLAGLNANGTFTTWLGQANGSLANNPGSGANALDASWRIAGSGDFNGDGRDDILWRHSSGEIGEWLGQSNGTFNNNGGAAANAVDNSWSVAGVADYNGDGRADILWRHSSGEVGQWLGQPSGGFANNGDAAANKVDLSWSISASGDFNGDGRGDVLWRHSSGEFAEWQGTASGALVNVGPVMPGASGSVVGSGDFNGDGRDDVLMRATNGAITAWLGQPSGQFTSFSPVQQLFDSRWKIVAIGDYNGDGSDDLLWRHASGEVGEWLADGTGHFTNIGAIPAIDPGAHIQSPDIFVV